MSESPNTLATDGHETKLAKSDDLESFSRTELIEHISNLKGSLEEAQRELAKKDAEAMAIFRKKWEAEAKDAGFSLDAVLTQNPPNGQDTSRKKKKAKYRGPNGQTWNGIGRPPLWVVAVKKQGRKPEEYSPEE